MYVLIHLFRCVDVYESLTIMLSVDVYNTLTIHGILSMDELPDSVLKVRQFWKNTCYNIAEHVFSLDDIEHGILRGKE